MPIEETLCPECDAKMVVRKNREGRSFWGCPNFPHCRGTRDNEGKSAMDKWHEKNPEEKINAKKAIKKIIPRYTMETSYPLFIIFI